MKIIHETKNSIFITELTLKEIEDIKNLLSESKPKKITTKEKAEMKKFYSDYLKTKREKGKM